MPHQYGWLLRIYYFLNIKKKLATYLASLGILTFPHCKRYSRGGDKEERITQGLKVLFEKMDPGGLVFIFTEAPTKNLELAEALIKTKIRCIHSKSEPHDPNANLSKYATK